MLSGEVEISAYQMAVANAAAKGGLDDMVDGRNPVNQPGCIKPYNMTINNGINYQPQLVSRISSINSSATIYRGSVVPIQLAILLFTGCRLIS